MIHRDIKQTEQIMMNCDVSEWREQEQITDSPMITEGFVLDHLGDEIDRKYRYGCGPVFEFQGCWFDLYKDMGRDELNVFNSILQSQTFSSESPLLTQGLPNHRLYFINKGYAKTVFLENGARIKGPNMRSGEIVGVESFFCGSPSQYSVVAARGAQIDYMDKDDVMDSFACVPGLIMKLKSFCLKRKASMDNNETISYDKRTQKRYPVPGLTAAKLLDAKGNPVGKPFRGRLMDISRGGYAFSISLNEEKLARRLIGRSIVSLIKVKKALFGEDVFWGGRIVHVEHRTGSNYSIHLKGDAASAHLSAMINCIAS